MEVKRSGWAFWVGLLYTLLSVLYLGIEAYLRYGNFTPPPELTRAVLQSGSPFFNEDIRMVSIAGSVIGLFFGITLMAQRKSVYAWTMATIVYTVGSSAYLFHNYANTPGMVTNLVVAAVVQILLLALVVRLLVTGRLG